MQATAGIVVDGRADAWTVVVIDSQQRTSESPLAWQSLGPDGETYAAMPSERMLWVAMDMDIETMNDKNYVNNKLAYALSKYLEDMGQCHAERMLYCPANAFAEIEDVSDLGTYETNARIIDIPHYITTDDLVHLNCVLARYPLCGHIIAAGLGHVLLHQQIPPDCEYLMHLDISKGGPYVDQLAWLLRALWNVGLTLEAANTLDVTVVTRRNGMYHVLIHGDGLTTISEDDGVLVPPLASLTPYSAQNEDAWTHILNVVRRCRVILVELRCDNLCNTGSFEWYISCGDLPDPPEWGEGNPHVRTWTFLVLHAATCGMIPFVSPLSLPLF